MHRCTQGLYFFIYTVVACGLCFTWWQDANRQKLLHVDYVPFQEQTPNTRQTRRVFFFFFVTRLTPASKRLRLKLEARCCGVESTSAGTYVQQQYIVSVFSGEKMAPLLLPWVGRHKVIEGRGLAES